MRWWIDMIHPHKITVSQGATNIERARWIAKSLGVKTAARYLCNRDWSLEAALWILTRK